MNREFGENRTLSIACEPRVGSVQLEYTSTGRQMMAVNSVRIGFV